MNFIYIFIISMIMKEFGIEIPDAEADEIKTVKQGLSILTVPWHVLVFMLNCYSLLAIDYIAKTPDGEYSVLFLSNGARSNYGFLSKVTYWFSMFMYPSSNNDAYAENEVLISVMSFSSRMSCYYNLKLKCSFDWIQT